MSAVVTALLQHSPERLVRDGHHRREGLDARFRRAASEYLSHRRHRLELAERTLQTASPLATLARGFAIVTRPDGTLVTDARSVPSGEEIEARLASGRLRARVTGSRDS